MKRGIVRGEWKKGRLKSEIEETCEKKWLIDIKNLVDSSQWMIDEWIVIVFSFKSREREREIEIVYKSFNSYIYIHIYIYCKLKKQKNNINSRFQDRSNRIFGYFVYWWTNKWETMSVNRGNRKEAATWWCLEANSRMTFNQRPTTWSG